MKSAPAILMMTVAAVLAAAFPAAPFAAPPDAGCTCRNRDGSKLELGETACIRVGDVAYLARCEMDLNVTTWRKLRDGCPEARMSVGTRHLL